MSTIVTRTSKGSALTWAEGDANITNLNTDKIELSNLSAATSGDGSLTYNNTTGQFTYAGPGTSEYRAAFSAGTGIVISNGVISLVTTDITGSVIAVDDQRNPNTITLSNPGSIDFGYQIEFFGGDVTAAGLQLGVIYYIAAKSGSNEFEISNTPDGAPISITDPGSITDFTYLAKPIEVALKLSELGDVSIAGTPTNNSVLTYNSSTQKWGAVTPDPAGIASVDEDTAPQLGGNLNVNNFSIVSTSDGNIVLAPNGTGRTVTNRLNYNEAVHSIGTTSGTVAPDAANGNVQTITLNGNLTLNAFTTPVAGQSITLIVNTGGTGRTLTSSMKWAGGEKTLSTTDTTDIISVFYDGTNYWASLAKDFK